MPWFNLFIIRLWTPKRQCFNPSQFSPWSLPLFWLLIDETLHLNVTHIIWDLHFLEEAPWPSFPLLSQCFKSHGKYSRQIPSFSNFAYIWNHFLLTYFSLVHACVKIHLEHTSLCLYLSVKPHFLKVSNLFS